MWSSVFAEVLVFMALTWKDFEFIQTLHESQEPVALELGASFLNC